MTNFRRNLPMSFGVGFLALCLVPATIVWLVHRGRTPRIDIVHRYSPLSWHHPLGTDPFGRDIAVYVFSGAFNSVAIALVAVITATIIGTALGLLADQSRWLRRIVIDVSILGLSFPPVLIAAMLVTAQGASISGEIMAIALFGIPAQIRMTVQSAQSIMVHDYIAAARLAGLGRLAIVLHHVLPNIAPLLVVHFTTSLALAVLSEAGLSYLGLGAPPPLPDIGRALAFYQNHIFDHPVLIVIPGMVIMFLVLGFNLCGDGLRDLLRIDRGQRQQEVEP